MVECGYNGTIGYQGFGLPGIKEAESDTLFNQVCQNHIIPFSGVTPKLDVYVKIR